MPSQQSFDFFSNDQDNFLEEDFLFFKENEKATRFLKAFFAQKNYLSSELQSLIIQGQKYSGKSHLINIMAKKHDAIFIKKSDLQSINPTSFFLENHFYIYENIDEIKNDEMLFHLINSAFEKKAFLLLSVINLNNFTLLDLKSRLKNIVTVLIENPDFETTKVLLAKAFSKKQLKLSNEIIDFFAKNVAGNYRRIHDIAKIAEFYCMENQKNLTLSAAKDVLRMINF